MFFRSISALMHPQILLNNPHAYLVGRINECVNFVTSNPIATPRSCLDLNRGVLEWDCAIRYSHGCIDAVFALRKLGRQKHINLQHIADKSSYSNYLN